MKSLVDTVVEALGKDTPMLNTIKLQINFHSTYLQREFQRQQTISNLTFEANKYIEDIVKFETKSPNDYEGIKTLYKKIFKYLLFKNTQHILNKYSSIVLTPAINNTIEREVAAALESVLPHAGLRPFLSLSAADKETQLCELSNIIIGIRLFNKDIKKGGVGLESFEELVNHPGRSLLNALNQELSEVIEQCDNYTIFFAVSDQLKDKCDPAALEVYKDELTFKRQYLINVLELKSDVQTSEQKVDSLVASYKKKMVDLQQLIGNKTSIPKDQVYPRFDSISQSYSELVEEKMLAMMRSEMMKVLFEHRAKLAGSLPEILMKEARLLYLENANKLKEEEAKFMSEQKSEAINNIIRLMPNTTPDFMHIPLDYLGFCLWTIVKRNGLLLPGKPNLGVYKYQDRYCVFCSVAAIEEFLADPEFFMKGLLAQCRRQPELIHLLRLEEHFKEISLAELLQGKEGQKPLFSISAPLMVDKEVETPLHFEEKKIVPDYSWNAWDLKKKALQIIKIRNKQTVSTQTLLSNFRRDTETQVWPAKEAATNTMVYASTNTELPKTYIVGLRDKNV
eukprot:TRINITY_DN7050_c0_g2_i3.p1 TRINITY_DN7050_c0_g2~~TRINITY_DN7050_c0_g2_i3.p1  ORF type:complete len:566 (-),score=211.03 TRINITY_DN7050_c0_g2_i3:120-1817(-)